MCSGTNLWRPRGARILGVLAATIYVAGATPASAEYLGNYGNLWAIQEENGVDQVVNKLKDLERTGELAQRMNRYRDDVINGIEHPDPIPGIETATHARSYLIDPSITVPENIQDDEGRIVVLAGTRINPLQYTSWSKSVVLIDARDQRQIDFALARLAAYPRDKVILVGGSYTEFMRKYKKRVYFDLGGVFTSRFDIKKVPAVVSQEGLALRVVEVAFDQQSNRPMVLQATDVAPHGHNEGGK